MSDWDFIIIGSGPGGTSVALPLLEAGCRVLMLERGTFLPKEAENRDSKAVYGDMRYRTRDRWRDEDGGDFRPWMHYFVGGNAKLYGAALYRLRKADFGEVNYSDGISPAWPLCYDDYAPFYDRAEKLYRVHGDRSADATEPTDQPYPHLPIEDEDLVEAIRAQLAQTGVSTFPLPVGVDMATRDEEEWQADLAHFDAYPDPSLRKAEPESTVRAFQKDFAEIFELRTECEARKFLYEKRQITGVEVIRGGESTTLTAHHYICAAGAINSAALFLRSAADGGFANRSGQVGRNYMCHVCTTAVATFDREFSASFAKTFGTNHWYRPDSGGCVDGSIQTQGKWDATQYTLEDWALEDGDDAEAKARSSAEFFFITEDLPRAENRVSLDGERICITRELTNLQEHDRLVMSLRRALTAGNRMSLVDFRAQLLPTAWCTHQCGTLRFGDDPTDSVLDRNCAAHDFDNLSVTDGSFFPSSSALNPTLTIVANALRVGEQLATQYHA